MTAPSSLDVLLPLKHLCEVNALEVEAERRPTRNLTRRMCATTGRRQGQRSAREQPTAPGHTTSDQTCRLPDLVQLLDEMVQG